MHEDTGTLLRKRLGARRRRRGENWTATQVSVRGLPHSPSQTLTIMSQSAPFVCASAKGRAGNGMGRDKHDIKERTRRQSHTLQMHASDFPCHVAFTLRQSGRAVCCGARARAPQREAALPALLSWVLAQAEQRPGLLGGPRVRPARSWTVPALCVHLSLPEEQRRGKVRRMDGPKERELHPLILPFDPLT